jgi:hypothetical protein
MHKTCLVFCMCNVYEFKKVYKYVYIRCLVSIVQALLCLGLDGTMFASDVTQNIKTGKKLFCLILFRSILLYIII